MPSRKQVNKNDTERACGKGVSAWQILTELCGDYTSKRIFGPTQENGKLKTVRQVGSIPQGLVSFGTDEGGRIYAVGYEGMIYQLDFSEARFDELQPDVVEKNSR